MKSIICVLFLLICLGSKAQVDAKLSSVEVSDETAQLIRNDIAKMTAELNSSKDKAKIHKDRGMKYLAINEFDNAVADYTKLIESSAKDAAHGYFFRGLSKKLSGKFYAISACDDMKRAKELGYDSDSTNWEGILQMCGF
ncbi:hypothetical protein [Flavobacterium sp.]|uniref:hypothetical protein n=1 Tax=Flavobacterium sp. TaxID=239 RepID=UPI00121E94C2|nr:hypothetical protein [Flavobacterium sp.]RZJ69480.1 MAG: hypothetical protein EOO49_17375 [Flavobacterium sp.]